MKLPDFNYEELCLSKVVIGVDEVGRGALAGPVVAAAVYLPIRPEFWLSLGIDDSKRLTPKKREELAEIIKEKAIWGIGEVNVAYINSRGIVKATEKAMRSAVAQVVSKCLNQQCYILIDAFHVKNVPGVGLKNQQAIIKGDQKSISIAAASIIAKVYRDNLMTKLHTISNIYGWKDNKGYGTKKHLTAIGKLGITKLHRKNFIHA